MRSDLNSTSPGSSFFVFFMNSFVGFWTQVGGNFRA